MKKIGAFFRRRGVIQLLSTLLFNANLRGFWQGTIYTGQLKTVCVPGLNCYSCPGALGSCPIGALQGVAAGRKYGFSFYAAGMLILFGVLFGRLICGFLCVFGFVQDLLYKIKSPKLRVPNRLDGWLRRLKYLVLLVPVLLLPNLLTNQFGIGTPYFCQWICPSGTLMGGIPLVSQNESLRQMLGFLFQWKVLVLLLIVSLSIFIYRPFCKYLCPLGAIYALFNRFAVYRMHLDGEKCVDCGACERACHMRVPVRKDINSPECIRCGACKAACPQGAISAGMKTAEPSAGEGRVCE